MKKIDSNPPQYFIKRDELSLKSFKKDWIDEFDDGALVIVDEGAGRTTHMVVETKKTLRLL